MKLDLNDPNEFTLEGVRKLIASKEDSTITQLRVTRNGIAYLADGLLVSDASWRAHALVFESWATGNSYVGAEAAGEDWWVRRVHRGLDTWWAR